LGLPNGNLTRIRIVEEITYARADWEERRRFGEVKAYVGPRLAAPTLTRSAGRTGNGHDAPADVRRGAPIEAHRGVTHHAMAFKRREIEIIEPNGSLQFVRALAGEEDDGAVCVDPVDGRRAVR
jgi:hypothetical protein